MRGVSVPRRMDGFENTSWWHAVEELRCLTTMPQYGSSARHLKLTASRRNTLAMNGIRSSDKITIPWRSIARRRRPEVDRAAVQPSWQRK